ncbi:MAG: o-succinylbenzoate--CoA ligase, partial [candidate division Zixibacteria bacterium]|nr:o-succinylbenzoate--CoA ligase [candidate division Zixibacteria bacterium]
MISPLTAASERWPEREALVCDEHSVSYREFARRVSVTASYLRDNGIAKGEHTGILADNCRQYPILLHALWRIGAVACPVSVRFPREAVAGMLDDIGCGTLVTLGGSFGMEWSSSIRSLDMAEVVSARPDDSGDRSDDPVFDLDCPGTILLTSGTTTEPKAVLHTYANHYYGALGSNENIKVSPGDRWLLTLPLWHVGGLAILFRTMLGGAALVIDDRGDNLEAVIERNLITHLSLVATQLGHLLDQDLSQGVADRLKAILVGGSFVPERMISEARNRGWPVCTTYGLTEMASQVTTTAVRDSVSRLRTSGRLLNHREMRLAADGEILVRGRTLFKGYVRGSELISGRDEDGWFHTGDVGSLDADGYLSVVGRKDNMFISGGENIHPEEIETALCCLPDVEEAVVVPIGDEEFGQRPVAFVRFIEGAKLTRAEIFACLGRSLPRFKLPVRLYSWPDVQRDHTF